MTEPAVNHLSSLRSAKGAVTKIAKEIDQMETMVCERLDPRRIERLTDSLYRAQETHEFHFDAMRNDGKSTEEQCQSQEDEQQALYDRHFEALTGLKDKHTAAVIMAQLSLALDELEVSHGIGYTPAMSYEMDHAASLSHKAQLARSTPGPRNHPEMVETGKSQSERMRVLLQSRAEYLASVATPSSVTPAVVRTAEPIMRVNPLKLDLPTFDGRIEKWHGFWKLLSALFEQHPELTTESKQAHILKQMGTPACREKAEAAFDFSPDYDTAVARLRAEFEKPRELLAHYVKTMTSLNRYRNKRSEINDLADSVERCVAGMKKIKVFTASQIISTLVVTYMEPDLLAHWGKATETQIQPPGVETLVTFLRRHAESVPVDIKEDRSRSKRPIKSERTVMRVSERSEQRASRTPSPSPSVSSSSSTAKCSCCNGYHTLYTCTQFKHLSCQERKDLSKRQDLCYNCLNPNHRATDCRSRNSCRVCNGHHHTLLHEDRPPTANKTGLVESRVRVTNGRSTVTTHCAVPRTALVEILSPHSQQYGRAQLDSGAEVSLVTRRFATQVKARKIANSSTTISGVEGSFVSPYQVSLTLKGRCGEMYDVLFHIVDHLAISASTADMKAVYSLPFLEHLELADPHYGTSSRVDMLLDMGSSLLCSKDELRRSNDRCLRAENTIFGWTVGGKLHCAKPSTLHHPQVLKVVPLEEPLEDTIQRMWEREEFPEDDVPSSTQDELALEQFRSSMRREEDGTYSVSLPKKVPAIKLGASRTMALRRTLSTERSHKRRGDGDRYQTAAAEYARLGHAEPVPSSEINNGCECHYYLPIHSVLKPSSSSTKFRLVFDASAKSANGIALNDILLPGPSVCASLTSTLIRFRNYRLGMTSDITKMFRGVRLNKEDRDYHRFFLRDEQGRMEEWRMNRVTFGVTSSPFLASQVLREIATEYQTEFPEAAQAIRQSFYVDDCLVGADDLATARQLREDVNAILAKANMVICKWRTSSPTLTATIPAHLREIEEPTTSPTPNPCYKTLGIYWDNYNDHFQITTPSISEIAQPSKRNLLSAIARVYDILGWYAPALLSAKLIMQETWRLQLQWEQPLPEDLRLQMNEWCSQLSVMTQHPVPRYYHQKDLTVQRVEIHGFADASSKGYGGVIYVRAIYTNLVVSVSLVMSRGKVVPVKNPPSIPRLELCAAVMTARMVQYVGSVLDIQPPHTYCWSDSSAVLGWINLAPAKLEVYVRNRVTKLTEYTSPDSWRYVNTNDNPADCLSRGILPKALISHPLWWHGPKWLSLDASAWPRRPDINLSRELPEVSANVHRISPEEPELCHKLDSFTRLVRVVAWIWRFIHHFHNKASCVTTCSGSLSLQELQYARISVLRYCQRLHYSKEYELLANKQSLPHQFSLAAMAPFLDDNGLLRVGGRLQKAGLSYDTTHPIILCQRSHIVYLLLKQLHLNSSHAGPQALMAIVSQTYYIPGVRQMLRRLSRECFVCREANAKLSQQKMGVLPAGRVTISRPFSNVGIDYAGPFDVKRGAIRRPTITKAYVCVFVCFATRAVHLEVVSDLTTEAFLAALNRFVGRRGYPTDVHTDNGSNFVGASNEFAEIKALLRAQDTQDSISLWASPRMINWHFNPAKAPHFGGLWEAAVGCMKKTLKKVMKDVIFNFEELTTVIVQVEAMLNSRPLVPVDSLSDEAIPLLTAGHFLIGAPLAAMPSLVDATSKITLVRRWNLTQRISYDLWNRWSTEYLVMLQRRSKWKDAKRQVCVGDLVLIRDESSFSRQWPKGRISKLYPGPDGLVRAVDVQTSAGVFRRPIARLCVLIEAVEDEPTTGENVRAKARCTEGPDDHASTP